MNVKMQTTVQFISDIAVFLRKITSSYYMKYEYIGTIFHVWNRADIRGPYAEEHLTDEQIKIHMFDKDLSHPINITISLYSPT